MVELNPAFADEGDSPKLRTEGEAPMGEAADNVVAFRQAGEQSQAEFQGNSAPSGPATAANEPVARIGENADGVLAAAELLAGATGVRWPMYLRNVKQILRTGNLDERKYGFGGLMDLLKACQRDGFVRIERDRRGGLRVFQGPNMVRPAQAQRSSPDEVNGNAADPRASGAELADDVPFGVEVIDGTEPDIIEIEPVSVVDTTAELLGRAKPRAPRVRAGRTGSVAAAPAAHAPRGRTSAGSSSGARKAAPKKPSASAKKPAPRSRKPVNKDDENFGNR